MQEQEKKHRELLYSGYITQEGFDTYFSDDKNTLIGIQNGIKIPKSAIGALKHAVGL